MTLQKNINLSPTHSGADIHVQKQLNVKAGLYIGPEIIFSAQGNNMR
ncbi:hypothetical protein ESA_01848 [Cronobacter sakazakii ATCC BAA-894]|uniref:Uncharacterized protein n=1 Tax=Cronobacter sakazakii (strain ATCC BAA-894) TaxID=290339 RepID=A7MKA3_CROS8|nr:hypothetical protein ESA_01848 [Cronobacter sakazakii ATCC BAA-894]